MRRAGPACALAVLLGAAPASAETLTVTSAADDGPGSLRAAIVAAQAEAGADEVRIAVSGTIALRSPLPDLTTELSIAGPDRSGLRLARALDATADFRILTVAAGADVEVRDLTIAGGRAVERSTAEGGGVRNAGTLRLRRVDVAGNEAISTLGVSSGGGIFNRGTLTVTESAIRQNTAVSTDDRASGGGIYNLGTLVVDDSIVSGNARVEAVSSAGAAGIDQAGFTATIRRSTIAANDGTGIHNGFADLTVENTTVSGNDGGITAIGGTTVVRSSTLTGGAGGRGPNLAGLEVDVPSSIHVQNTILADPGADRPNCTTHLQVDASSGGHNLADDGSCGYLTAPGDRQGIDPGLGPLGDNGGSTPTHAIAAASPAHDRGSSGPLAADQRGRPRPVDDPAVADADDGADVGAFELSAPSPAPSGTALPPRSSPSNRFHFGRVTLRRRSGTAVVRVRLPGAGRVVLSGRGVQRTSRRALAARSLRLIVRPAGGARRRLARRGRTTVLLHVAFTPHDGIGSARKLLLRLTQKRLDTPAEQK